MKNTAVVIFNDNDATLNADSHVGLRMAEVNKEKNVELEVYSFGPGQGAYSSGETEGVKATFKETILELVKAGIMVRTCDNTANAKGTAEALINDGIKLGFAKNAFLRSSDKQASVLNF